MVRVRRPGLVMVLKSSGPGQTAFLPRVAVPSVSSVMRRVCVAAVAVIVLLCAQAPGRAKAQGFFQSLFGSPAQQPAFQPQPHARRIVESPYGYRASPNRAQGAQARDRDHDNDDDRSSHTFDKSGRYRTLCVRMCDGYYWPISFAARRSHFYQDANLCRSNCGEESRLFFHPSRDGDTKDMVDVTGRAYAKLPTAYLYRKSAVEGCKCKPDPWARTELDRHRLYALNEASERQRTEMAASLTELQKSSQLTEKPHPGPSDKAVAVRFAQLGATDKVPTDKAPTERAVAPWKPQSAVPMIATTDPARPSDPAIAASGGVGAEASPELSKPDLEPSPIAPPVAEVAAPDPVATPAAEASKRRRADRPVRPERSDRRQASADLNRPRSTQTKAHAPKPGGSFGLGAGSKSMRWPGE